MIGKKPVPIVIERFTPQMTEGEIKQALAGHGQDPKVKAFLQILAVNLADVRQRAEEEQPIGEMRTYYNGGAATLALILEQVRELTGGEA